MSGPKQGYNNRVAARPRARAIVVPTLAGKRIFRDGASRSGGVGVASAVPGVGGGCAMKMRRVPETHKGPAPLMRGLFLSPRGVVTTARVCVCTGI